MNSLLDCFKKAVAVDVYAQPDHQFKNKLNQTNLVFEPTDSPSPLFSHVRLYRKNFKVNCNNPNDLNEARISFNETLNNLNATFRQISTPSFVQSLYRQVCLHADTTQIRNERGESIGYHHYKNALKDTIESFFSNADTSVKFNIGNGTIYLNEKVVINSGLTSPTSLSQGLVQFLNFIPQGNYKREYKVLSAKLSRSYPSGSWLNISGDTALELCFKRLLYSSLLACFTKLKEYLSQQRDIINVVDPLLLSLSETISKLTIDIDKVITQPRLPEKYIESLQVVASNQDLKDLVALGLGPDSISTFYLREAPQIVFKEIADYLGAKSVYIVNFYAAEEQEGYPGEFFDECYDDHLSLPHKSVREALQKIKTLLETDDSHFNLLFDKSRLNINVTGTSDYDHRSGGTSWECEYIDIHLGIAEPLLNSEQTLRFVFDVKDK